MKSFDQSLKYLIKQEPESFIRFGQDDPTVRILRPAEVSLPSRGRDVDAGYLVIIDQKPLLAHVEFHRRHQKLDDLAVDVAEAQVRFYRRERLPVVTHVWDLYGSAKDPLFEDRLLVMGAGTGGPRTQSSFRRVNLRALDWIQFLDRAPPCLWPLVPLTRDGATVDVVREVVGRIEDRDDLGLSHRADHLAVLWFVAEAERVPVAMLKDCILEEQLMESILYQEILKKGEIRKEAETVLRVLTNRIGVVEPAVRERLQAQTDPETLDAWYSEALLAVTAEEAKRLAARIGGAPIPSPQPQ